MASSLSLVDYQDSSSSEEDPKQPVLNSVATSCQSQTKALPVKRQKLDTIEHSVKIPLPESITTMFSDKEAKQKREDTRKNHQGRVRSFEHVRGNWATHVFVDIEQCRSLMSSFAEEVVNLLQSEYKDRQWHTMDKFHLSLSRVFPIGLHWVDPLVSGLKKSIAAIPRWLVSFSGVTCLVNDEKTRTFVVVQASSGTEELQQLISRVDDELAEFRLPKYYDDPSYHASVAWTVGDCRVSDNVLKRLNALLDEECQLENYTEEISTVSLKSGNRSFRLSMK